MTIHLTVEQCNLLVSFLTHHITELREEIIHTENYTYKSNLKHQKQELEHLLINITEKNELVEEPVNG